MTFILATRSIFYNAAVNILDKATDSDEEMHRDVCRFVDLLWKTAYIENSQKIFLLIAPLVKKKNNVIN